MKKTLRIIGICIIIAGIIILLAPIIIRKITEAQIKNTIEDFKQEVETGSELSEMDILRQRLTEYNEVLYSEGQQLVDAFSYENAEFDLTQYGFSENIIGYIDIPKMDVCLPIYLGATQDNLYKGAALLSQTSMPIGGANTNSVIAAHRGLIRASMFKDINLLEVGDEIIITNLWEELTYTVCEIKIINPEDIDEILIQEGREMITLITCHPYGSNTQRYVVYAERLT